jgi:hypothetical protein
MIMQPVVIIYTVFEKQILQVPENKNTGQEEEYLAQEIVHFERATKRLKVIT